MAKNTHVSDDGNVALDFSGYEEAEVEVADEVSNNEETEVETEVEENVTESIETAAEEPAEDEHEQVNRGVQKRIDRLTKKMREAERREQEALAYAQSVKSESEKLRTQVSTLDTGYLNEYGGRIAAEESTAKEELKQAMLANDTDAVVEAQTKIAQLAVSAQKHAEAERQMHVRQQQIQQQREQQAQQVQQQPQAQAQPAPPEPAPDPQAEAWAKKHEWFGTDEAMTYATFGIHKRLVEKEGFDPQSQEYYDEIDRQIVKAFPHKFGAEKETSKRPVQTVAGNSRSTSSGRKSRKVKLTPSQVAVANKLGVPLEEYAKHVKA